MNYRLYQQMMLVNDINHSQPQWHCLLPLPPIYGQMGDGLLLIYQH